MDYRTADKMIDLAQRAREAAEIKNRTQFETNRRKAARYVPKCLKQALKQIEEASVNGKYAIDYKPPFWNPRYWFAWNKHLRDLLTIELQRQNFKCSVPFDSTSLRIYWGKE